MFRDKSTVGFLCVALVVSMAASIAWATTGPCCPDNAECPKYIVKSCNQIPLPDVCATCYHWLWGYNCCRFARTGYDCNGDGDAWDPDDCIEMHFQGYWSHQCQSPSCP